MYTIGIDLHKHESQLCIHVEGHPFIELRIATTRERFAAALTPHAPARVLLEASTESEWVACYLESLGHTVIVVDPNFAPMYATRSRRVKTDKRDARALCEACARGTYQATHRLSETKRHVRAELTVRETLVRTRTRCVAVIKAAVRREGLRLSAGTPEHSARKLAVLPLTSATRAEVAPLLTLIALLNTQIEEADDRLTVLAATSAPARLLQSMPMIGPVTALGFVAGLDDITRFPSAPHVAAYLGLVPSEYSSGKRQQGGTLRNAATRAPDGCSLKPRGASCGPRIPHSPPSTLDGAAHRPSRPPGRHRGTGAPSGDAVLRHVAHQYAVSRRPPPSDTVGGSRLAIAPTDHRACVHDEMTNGTRRRVLRLGRG